MPILEIGFPTIISTFLLYKLSLQATSEYSAERQLNDLLFPRINQKLQKRKQTYQNEC